MGENPKLGLIMKRLVERTISKTKGQDYKLDPNLSSYRIFQVVCQRIGMLIRGFFKKAVLKKAGKRLFIGKRVKFKCGKRIRLGSGVTIYDNCFINGLSKKGIIIGNNFSLGRNSIIDCTGVISNLGDSLVVGDNVGISPNFTLFVRGSVEIGNDVIIGPTVTIIAENHRFDDIETLIRVQGTKRSGIKICNNVWIGASATILDGVTLGEGCIVAAGAVVTKDVEPFTIVGGVPARLIRKRNNEDTNGK